MYKKLVSLLLSFSLCVSLLSIAVFAGTSDTILKVNGVNITESNLSVACGTGTAKYNPNTNELTLTDATLTNGGIECTKSDLNLVLVGKNSINDYDYYDNDNIEYFDGIVSGGNLSITGSGDLKIILDSAYANGITSSKDITINMEGNLHVNSEQTTIQAGNDINILGSKSIFLRSNQYGMSAANTVKISGNGPITVYSVGNVGASGGPGISGKNGIELNNDNSIYIEAKTNGLYSSAGSITQNGTGSITITSTNGKSAIYSELDTNLLGSSNIKLNSKYYGIRSNKGNITIAGNNNVEFKNDSSESISIYGEKDINILDKAQINIDSNYMGIYSNKGNITISSNSDIDIITKDVGIISSTGSVSLLGESFTTINTGSFAVMTSSDLILDHDGIIEIHASTGLAAGNGDILISGNGTTYITSTYSGAIIASGHTLSICDAMEVDINSTTDYAISLYGNDCTIKLEGEIGSLTLSSPEKTRNVNLDEVDYIFDVEKPDVYNVDGSIIENYVRYTLNTCPVSFDMGGHGTSINSQNVTFNGKVTRPSDPEAAGYKFEGWYIDKDLTTAFDFDTAITTKTTLYAKWTCLHSNTEIKNKKDATTTSTGYTGDTYCKDCGVLVSSGAAIPTLTPSTTGAPTIAPTSAPTTTSQPTSAPTSAPELNVGDFINRCYSVALGRSADEAGYNYWVDNLNNGQACGAQVGYGFIFSQEYINKNRSDEEFVTDMYAMYFGREADSDGFNYWVGLLGSGLTREDIMAGFANSEEFYNLCNKYGVVCGTYLVGVPNDVQGGVNCFVARLYKVCLNRLPDMGGQAGWVLKLMNGDVTGTSCAYGFVFSPEFIGKNPSNEDFVNYMYAAFFGRAADEAGFNAWVDVLNGGGSYEDVFAGFSGSAEFANLCASYGIQA